MSLMFKIVKTEDEKNKEENQSTGAKFLKRIYDKDEFDEWKNFRLSASLHSGRVSFSFKHLSDSPPSGGQNIIDAQKGILSLGKFSKEDTTQRLTTDFKIQIFAEPVAYEPVHYNNFFSTSHVSNIFAHKKKLPFFQGRIDKIVRGQSWNTAWETIISGQAAYGNFLDSDISRSPESLDAKEERITDIEKTLGEYGTSFCYEDKDIEKETIAAMPLTQQRFWDVFLSHLKLKGLFAYGTMDGKIMIARISPKNVQEKGTFKEGDDFIRSVYVEELKGFTEIISHIGSSYVKTVLREDNPFSRRTKGIVISSEGEGKDHENTNKSSNNSELEMRGIKEKEKRRSIKMTINGWRAAWEEFYWINDIIILNFPSLKTEGEPWRIISVHFSEDEKGFRQTRLSLQPVVVPQQAKKEKGVKK